MPAHPPPLLGCFFFPCSLFSHELFPISWIAPELGVGHPARLFLLAVYPAVFGMLVSPPSSRSRPLSAARGPGLMTWPPASVCFVVRFVPPHTELSPALLSPARNGLVTCRFSFARYNDPSLFLLPDRTGSTGICLLRKVTLAFPCPGFFFFFLWVFFFSTGQFFHFLFFFFFPASPCRGERGRCIQCHLLAEPFPLPFLASLLWPSAPEMILILPSVFPPFFSFKDVWVFPSSKVIMALCVAERVLFPSQSRPSGSSMGLFCPHTRPHVRS